MSGVDLEAELYAAQGALTPAHRRDLLTAGVPSAAFLWGLVGVAPVLLEHDRFVPMVGEMLSLIVPVRVGDPHSCEWPDPGEAIRYGDLVDLVAFRLEEPERWALRTGAASWLGACEPQYLNPEPVLIHRDPLDWFRYDCSGIVPLSRDPDEIRSLLLSIQSPAVARPDHGRRLSAMRDRPYAASPFMVLVEDEVPP